MKPLKKHLAVAVKEKAVKAILFKNKSVAEIATSLDVNRSIVYKWITRYEKYKSLEPVNNEPRGPEKKINPDNATKVLDLLKNPASSFGYTTDFWNIKRVTQELKKELNITISVMTMHRMLTQYQGFYRATATNYLKPQTSHQRKMVGEVKKVMKQHNAILYFHNEATVSLKTMILTTWGEPLGEEILKKNKVSGSISMISGITQDGRLIFNVRDGKKRYGASDVIDFLSQLVMYHSRRHLVVIMDDRPCHQAKLVKNYIASQPKLHVFHV